MVFACVNRLDLLFISFLTQRLGLPRLGGRISLGLDARNSRQRPTEAIQEGMQVRTCDMAYTDVTRLKDMNSCFINSF